MESRWETVAGVRGHALSGGNGPPLVLVHGLAVSSRYFRPLARRLLARFAVLAPDLPGYGRSGTPARPLAVPELARALERWMDLAGAESAPLVANSLGCQVAVDLAVRAPARVTRLVLVGPTFDPCAPSLARQAARLARDVPREPLGLNLSELRDYLRMGPRRIIATARLGLADPFTAKLPRLSQPTLVIRGSRDPVVPAAWAARVAELSRGRLAVVPGAPHAAHWAAADAVARLIEEFH
jgi:pimeloyl-ACP methyl ester carboxylesterase